jgi:hypothetical protein
VIATATTTGLPVMRAMPLAFPGNALVREFDTQFMCGDALLIAPIVREGGEVDMRYLPAAVRPQHAPARRRAAGAALPREARPVPGVRA